MMRVREASEDTLVVTNGYSCREQIEQGAGRKSMHLAEVIDEAIRFRVSQVRYV